MLGCCSAAVVPFGIGTTVGTRKKLMVATFPKWQVTFLPASLFFLLRFSMTMICGVGRRAAGLARRALSTAQPQVFNRAVKRKQRNRAVRLSPSEPQRKRSRSRSRSRERERERVELVFYTSTSISPLTHTTHKHTATDARRRLSAV